MNPQHRIPSPPRALLGSLSAAIVLVALAATLGVAGSALATPKTQAAPLIHKLPTVVITVQRSAR